MDKELREALQALGLMWNQYCGERRHLFMTAGEHASEVLMRHGLLKDEYSEVSYEKLDAMYSDSVSPALSSESEATQTSPNN